jgi:hypothetical protein
VIMLLLWVRFFIIYIMYYYGLEYPIVGKLILEKKKCVFNQMFSFCSSFILTIF